MIFRKMPNLENSVKSIYTFNMKIFREIKSQCVKERLYSLHKYFVKPLHVFFHFADDMALL